MKNICTITDITSQGLGVTRLDGEVIFVEGGLPGDQVTLKDLKYDQRVTHAQVDEWHALSPDRVEPFCPHADFCDGCPLQALSVSAQARIKANHIQNAFERIAGQSVNSVDFVSAPEQKHYRNKISLKVEDFQLGYHSRKTNRHVAIETCPIASRQIDACIPQVNALLQEIRPDLMSQVIFRSGQNGLMIILEADHVNNSVLTFAQACSELDSVISVYLTTEKGRKRRTRLLFGQKYLRDRIGDFEFEISPEAFFQVNSLQIQKLYETALSLLPKKHYSKGLDLYCGIGSITLYASKYADHLTGVEINPKAVKDAKRNAHINGISNVHFECSRSEDATDLLQTRPDFVIVDPPRKGLEHKLIDAICKNKISTVLYISCNPSTLARDVKRFVDRGYKPSDPIGVDMFVHSLHVETTVLLSKMNVDQYNEVKSLDERARINRFKKQDSLFAN